MCENSEPDAFQVGSVRTRILDGADIQCRVAILFDRAPAIETILQQYFPHLGKVHVALPEVAEDALAAGLVEAGALGDGIGPYLVIDVLEMDIDYAVHVPPHEGDRIEACEMGMTGIEASAGSSSLSSGILEVSITTFVVIAA